MAKNWTLGRVVLILWFLFATVFALYSGWGALNDVIFRQGVQRGVLLGQNDTITRVIQLSTDCNTVSLFAGEGENRVEVGLVDSVCSASQINAARDAAKGAAAIPVVETKPVVVATPEVEVEKEVEEVEVEEPVSEETEA